MNNSNPFTSPTFSNYWSEYFSKKKRSFLFLKEVSCYASKIPGVFINTGKNLTKGISYSIEREQANEIKGKTILLYDVIPSMTSKEVVPPNIGRFTVKQYPGYAINLERFDSLQDYMSSTFKKSSRYKLKKYKKRLEESFEISFKSIGPDVSTEEYNQLFEKFKDLLIKRFTEKKVYNNNLDESEWNFYQGVVLPLIRERKATLFVLSNKEEPISITLAYFSDDRIFDAITVFDIDYAKFHLGSVKIMYLIDWTINNKWNILDFSKGHFLYKTRWSNEHYNFHYHILYDKSSFFSQLKAYVLKYFFVLKQYLREKEFNQLLHKLRFFISSNTDKEESELKFSFQTIDAPISEKNLIEMNGIDEENIVLKKAVFFFCI